MAEAGWAFLQVARQETKEAYPALTEYGWMRCSSYAGRPFYALPLAVIGAHFDDYAEFGDEDGKKFFISPQWVASLNACT